MTQKAPSPMGQKKKGSKKYANHNYNNNHNVYHPNLMVFSQSRKYRTTQKNTMYWYINTNSLHSNQHHI